jgi:tRNA dimethylallyltransferase
MVSAWPPLLILVGPTAVGKTEAAIQLALRLGGEIVSCDSRLFYRGMNIGTAKPTIEERQGVPHHLIDIANPDETLSLGVFQRLARLAIADINTRNRLPILVGGTGQYIRAVVQGWEIPPVEPDPRLRVALEAWGAEVGMHGLHARLAVVDPEAASAIDARNARRTVRALEVIFVTGRRFSAQRNSGPPVYDTLIIGLLRSRMELYERIDRRIDAMIRAGFIEEVRALLSRGYPPELPAFSAIGYREVIAFLQEKMTLEDAIAQMKRQTRIFVRRQANWFKPEDPLILWYPAGVDNLAPIETKIRDWLSNHLTY